MPPDLNAPLPISTTVSGDRGASYELLGRLAVGGMAELYLARSQGADGVRRVVVLKRILPHLAEDPEFVRMFRDEAYLAATLNHPNVVKVFDIGKHEEDYYFTMEYVHGENLRAILRTAQKRGAAIPLPHLLTIALGITAGLHYAHEQVDNEGNPLQIVHRDVSPTNVLVAYDGAVKIVDFGIAKAAAATHITQAGMLKGKASYMAPEQCRAEAVDRRSDVFAIGILLFEMTTLTRLFRGENELAILHQVLTGAVPPPSTRREGYPPELERIVLKALHASPDRRYQTAAELQTDLARFAGAHGLIPSNVALGQYIRSLFGEKPLPWKDEDTAPPSAESASGLRTSADGLAFEHADETDQTQHRTPAPTASATSPVRNAQPPAPPRAGAVRSPSTPGRRGPAGRRPPTGNAAAASPRRAVAPLAPSTARSEWAPPPSPKGSIPKRTPRPLKRPPQPTGPVTAPNRTVPAPSVKATTGAAPRGPRRSVAAAPGSQWRPAGQASIASADAKPRPGRPVPRSSPVPATSTNAPTKPRNPRVTIMRGGGQPSPTAPALKPPAGTTAATRPRRTGPSIEYTPPVPELDGGPDLKTEIARATATNDDATIVTTGAATPSIVPQLRPDSAGTEPGKPTLLTPANAPAAATPRTAITGATVAPGALVAPIARVAPGATIAPGAATAPAASAPGNVARPEYAPPAPQYDLEGPSASRTHVAAGDELDAKIEKTQVAQLSADDVRAFIAAAPATTTPGPASRVREARPATAKARKFEKPAAPAPAARPAAKTQAPGAPPFVPTATARAPPGPASRTAMLASTVPGTPSAPKPAPPAPKPAPPAKASPSPSRGARDTLFEMTATPLALGGNRKGPPTAIRGRAAPGAAPPPHAGAPELTEDDLEEVQTTPMDRAEVAAFVDQEHGRGTEPSPVIGREPPSASPLAAPQHWADEAPSVAPTPSLAPDGTTLPAKAPSSTTRVVLLVISFFLLAALCVGGWYVLWGPGRPQTPPLPTETEEASPQAGIPAAAAPEDVGAGDLNDLRVDAGIDTDSPADDVGASADAKLDVPTEDGLATGGDDDATPAADTPPAGDPAPPIPGPEPAAEPGPGPGDENGSETATLPPEPGGKKSDGKKSSGKKSSGKKSDGKKSSGKKSSGKKSSDKKSSDKKSSGKKSDGKKKGGKKKGGGSPSPFPSFGPGSNVPP